MKKYRHIFFDLDNTLTRSRSPITSAMENALQRLSRSHTIVVISGARNTQMRKQIGNRIAQCAYCLAQNGNDATHIDTSLWKHALAPPQKEEIQCHIESIKRHDPAHFKAVGESDLVEDRQCQISFSLIGHNADIAEKERFDPTHEKRKTLLAHVPFVSRTTEVRTGGTTCFDYMPHGKHKGYNVKKLIEHAGWDTQECLYVGDALFPGGNDESVIGVIETYSVQSPEDTLKLLQKMVS